MLVQMESVINEDPTPAPADQLGFVIEMARRHVDDIDSGLEDGTYDAPDNEDIEEKRLALNATYALYGRLIACLDVCDGVDTKLLVEMGKGAMNRHRDRAYQARNLLEGFLDSHCCLMGLIQEARKLTTQP